MKMAPTQEELRTSEQWMKYEEFAGTSIMDPDGWDRRNFEYSYYEELITCDEMHRRISQSTIKLR